MTQRILALLHINLKTLVLMLSPCFILLWEVSAGPIQTSSLVYQGGAFLMFSDCVSSEKELTQLIYLCLFLLSCVG